MSVEVKMASFSPEMTSAKVVKWAVDVGSTVLSGDTIAEIESDKAVMDILAPQDGTLSEILVPAGNGATEVGAVIARLLPPGTHVEQSIASGAKDQIHTSPVEDVTINIVMPALAPSMESASLVRWLVSKGDVVTVGDVIAEVETDKATLEVEATDNGIITDIVVSSGTADVPVNAVIALMSSNVTASSSRSNADSTRTIEESPEVPEHDPSFSATPLAKRTASQLGVDITTVEGSGAKGRITRADVEEKARSNEHEAITADDVTLRLFAPGSFENIPHSSMRKTIARRLLESKRTIPHFYISTDCRVDALLDMRSRLNAASPPEGSPGAYRLTVNDMVIRAHALALRDFPSANVTWTESSLLQHSSVDVGVAVAIPNGLITPIIRHADSKPLSVISREMSNLVSRARSQQLRPDEYQGGTTSLSNLGMFGVTSFAAIVNPPHATILAVGSSEKRAVVVDDHLVSASEMTVTLSTDHRAVDGALAAQVLKAFKNYIEHPITMMV